MKKSFLILSIALAFVVGCGKNHLKIAKAKLAEMQKTMEKEAKEKTDIYNPMPINLQALKDMKSGRAMANAKYHGLKYDSSPDRMIGKKENTQFDVSAMDPDKRPSKGTVQHITGQWRYRWEKINLETDPYSVKAEATYLIFYHAPITIEFVKEQEKKTGKPYDPRGTGISRSNPGKKKDLIYEYNESTESWDLKEEIETYNSMDQ